MAQFNIDVVTRFREEGLSGVIASLRTQLAALSASSLRGAAAAGQYGRLQTQTEAGLQHLRREGVISGQEFSDIRRQVRAVFGEMREQLARVLGQARVPTWKAVEARAQTWRQTPAGLFVPPREQGALDERLTVLRTRRTRAEESAAATAAASASAENREFARRRQAQTRRNNVLARILANEQGMLDSKVRQRADEIRIERDTRRRAAAEFGTGRGPIAGLPRRLQTTAGYGLSGLAFYGAAAGISSMIRSTEELDRVLRQVESQFEAVGDAAEFPGARESILRIARETGEAGTTVAHVARTMKGAFGDTEVAIRNTEAAMRIAVVTGLEQSEVLDSLVAGALSFRNESEDASQSVERFGDVAVAAMYQFGVPAEEVTRFLADIAPAASEAGLSLEQMAILGGQAMQLSGRGSAAIAEALGRVIPGLKQAGDEILRIYRDTPSLQGRMAEIATALAEGRTGDVLIALLRDWGQLSQVSRDAMLNLLGQRRETQAIIPIFQQADEVVRLLGEGLNSTGKLGEEFANQQDSVARQMAQLREEARQLGVDLFEAGLDDFLREMIELGADVVGVIRFLADGFKSLPEPVRDAAIDLVKLLVVLKGIDIALKSIGVSGGIAALARGLAGRAAAGQVAGLAAPAVAGQLTLPGLAAAGTAGRAGMFASSRAGLAAATAAIPPAAALALAGFATYQAYSAVREQRAGGAEDEKRLVELFENADRDEVRKWVKHKTDFWTRFGNRIRGTEHAENIARQEMESWGREDVVKESDLELKAQALRNIGAFDEATLRRVQREVERRPRTYGRGLKDVGTLTPEEWEQFLKRLREGGEEELEFINLILADLAKRPGAEHYRKELERLRDEIRAKARVGLTATPAQARAEQLRQSVEELQQAYEAGLASAGQYIAELDKEIAHLQYLQSLSATTDRAKEIAALLRKRNDLYSSLARQTLDLRLELGKVAGGGPEQRAQELRAFLARGDITDPQVRLQAARDLVDVEREIYEQQVEMADSVEERARLLAQGFKIPEAARIEVVKGELLNLNVTWQRFVSQFTTDYADMAAFAQSVAQRMVTEGLSLVEATRAEIAARQADLPSVAELQRRLTQARRMGEVEEEKNIRRQLDEARRRQAAGPVPEDLGGTTAPPGTGVLSPEEKARQDEITRQKERTRDEARLNLDRARAEAVGSSLELARLELRAADEMARKAETIPDELEREAARLDAAAARIRGETAVRDAMEAAADAQSELAEAMALAAGDTVGAAEEALKQVRDRIARALARGLTEENTELRQLRIEEVNAVADLAQKRAASAEADIDFELEMGRITVGQAVNRLRAMLALEQNEQRRRDLQLKIKNLLESVSGDIAFNIPSEITLPTLYEVRRVRAAAERGVGYSDQRVITISMVNNNATDYQGAIDRTLETIATASTRSGTDRGLY